MERCLQSGSFFLGDFLCSGTEPYSWPLWPLPTLSDLSLAALTAKRLERCVICGGLLLWSLFGRSKPLPPPTGSSENFRRTLVLWGAGTRHLDWYRPSVELFLLLLFLWLSWWLLLRCT